MPSVAVEAVSVTGLPDFMYGEERATLPPASLTAAAVTG